MTQAKIFQETKAKKKPEKPKKPKNSIENLALLAEFERFCVELFSEIKKEEKLLQDFGFEYQSDYFFPKFSLVVEVNGGQFVAGRHNSGKKSRIEGGKVIKVKNPKTNRMVSKRIGGYMVTQYEADIRKANLSQIQGYIYLQYTYEQLERQEYKKQLICVFKKTKATLILNTMNLKKIGETTAQVRPFIIQYLDENGNQFDLKREKWPIEIYNNFNRLCKHFFEFQGVASYHCASIAFKRDSENGYSLTCEMQTPIGRATGKYTFKCQVERMEESVIRDLENQEARESMRKCNVIVQCIEELSDIVDNKIDELLVADVEKDDRQYEINFDSPAQKVKKEKANNRLEPKSTILELSESNEEPETDYEIDDIVTVE